MAVPTKVIALPSASTCATCGLALDEGARAQWEPSSRTVTCLPCAGVTETPPPPAAPVSSDRPERAGVSARREHERRLDRRARHLDERFGRWAKLVRFLSADPQSTEAWRHGSEGERKLAEGLQRRLGDRSVILHDRRIPKSTANIDHLVIAASGVWVIDTKRYNGLVERRDKGGWFTTDHHLYVGGRDRMSLVRGMTRQVDAVLAVLDGTPAPVHAALCFVDAEWKRSAKAFTIGGVWVTWGERLAEMISEPGPLSETEVLGVATRLHDALHPA